MTKKLNDKQKLFAKEYLVDLNATQAAIRAGYSPKTAKSQGQRLLTHVDIAELIEKGKAERQERVKIDADYVLNQAVKLHERCMQEISPVMVRQGKELVPLIDDEGRQVFQFNANGAAKGLDLIGKHITVQAFNEKKTVTLDLENATDEELDRELERLRKGE